MNLRAALYIQIFLISAMLSGAAMAAGVSPDQIEAIVGSSSNVSVNQAPADIVTREAEIATRMLGKNNPAWNSSNPTWQLVYTKVQADMEEDYKPIQNYMEHNDANDVMAENMDLSDVKVITAYLSTDEGRRYQDFTKQADAVLSSCMANLIMHTKPVAKVSLSKEQSQQYEQMLKESSIFQSTVALMTAKQKQHQDTSGAIDISGFMLGIAMQQNTEKAGDLYQKYHADIDKFDAFNHSEAQQHLFKAKAIAALHIGQKVHDLQAAQAPSVKKHQEQWQALYQREVIKGEQ